MTLKFYLLSAWIVFEDGDHDFSHVCLEGHDLEDLHHEAAQALSPDTVLQLDLVHVEDLCERIR